ncbi:MAG: AAA family ATPase [Planctomycetes bacterium]|nr:AAA family ATPase [Planctomycetota bacterium]
MEFPKLKLRRLKIVRFRNVAPGCELRFDDGVNVLLGKNGTGKTTLLALISCVVRSDFTTFASEPFEVEYDLAPEPLMKVRVANAEVTNVGPAPDVLPSETRFRLRLWVSLTVPAGELHVESDGINVESRIGGRTKQVSLPGHGLQHAVAYSLLEHEIGDDPAQPHLHGMIHTREAYRFDESLDSFRAMTSAPAYLSFRGPSAPWPTILSEFRGGGWLTVFLPSSLVPRAEVEDRLELELTGLIAQSGADLRDGAALLGFARVIWIADLLEGEPGNRRFTRFAFRLVRHDGAALSHEHLSYGQKRMLALLYYMACNPQVLIADEVVNGLHHEWIAAVMERIGDRQAFLTSQNPLLFDYLSVDSADRAGRMFVLCSAEQDERGKTTVTWRNMAPEEAARFHEDLAAGVEYPSEVLLRRGLW